MDNIKVVIATEFHIDVVNDRYYAKTQFSTILKRYYCAFGKLKICARVRNTDLVAKSSVDITEMVESILDMPSLERTLLGRYDRKIENYIIDSNLIICRVPSAIAYKAFDIAKANHINTLVEVMGDAWDSYWNHGLIGKMIAPYMFLKMKYIVAHSDYAIYVTSEFLQKRYPRKNSSISASNVLIDDVPESVLVNRIGRIESFSPQDIVLMTAASVDIRHKGQEYVIKAIPKLNDVGLKVNYYLAGDGDNTYLSEIASDLNIQDQVHFLGRLTLDEVMDYLDKTDIYIQPSLQEGLPRSVIEALSRGCPCIGANTAGIPELIVDQYIVKRKNANDIAAKIMDYCNSSLNEKIEVATKNFYEAKNYTSEVLDNRRNDYFDMIIQDSVGAKV